jgi:PAS domain S-box-containing protein
MAPSPEHRRPRRRPRKAAREAGSGALESVPPPDPTGPTLVISTEPGRIHLAGERLLLLSATALGQIRQELHEVLGPIMAHEVLFRFAFTDGVIAARAVRARSPGATPHEVLMTGPVFHTLAGMARVTVDGTDFEEEFRSISGRWEDSFEAEQSLRLFGPVEWTACWVLTGFASGFASEAIDRDLLCVERECRARGDPVCRFEILPAAGFPGLARKVEALRRGGSISDRMRPAITRLWEQVFTSSNFLARILRDSADAIISVDGDEVIRTWNRGAEELFGYASREVIGRHFRFLVPADLLARGEIEKIRTAAREQGSLRNYETRRLARDGAELHVSLTRTSIYDAHGRYIGASAILRDITERKKLVEQLIQAERLAEVGEMAAHVAHEIKNPLAGISGAIQVLADRTPPDDPRSAVFSDVLEHIHRLDRTVVSLLTLTRRYRPVKAPTDLALVLDSALSQLRGTEVFAGVEVRPDFAPDTGPVPVDPQQFIQVFLNLLLNAAQATEPSPGSPHHPADRRIFVRSHRQGAEVTLEVEDHGSGMSPDVLRQVLKPFFTTRTRGTGLGLPIARRIIEAHGGRLQIDSTPGQGTTIRLVLPTS